MFCPRCRKFITNKEEPHARVQPLINAFDPVSNGFRCYYTGILLEEYDFRSPWYLTFDHRIPGKKGNLVVCSFWVNQLKSYLTESEFRAVI